MFVYRGSFRMMFIVFLVAYVYKLALNRVEHAAYVLLRLLGLNQFMTLASGVRYLESSAASVQPARLNDRMRTTLLRIYCKTFIFGFISGPCRGHVGEGYVQGMYGTVGTTRRFMSEAICHGNFQTHANRHRTFRTATIISSACSSTDCTVVQYPYTGTASHRCPLGDAVKYFMRRGLAYLVARLLRQAGAAKTDIIVFEVSNLRQGDKTRPGDVVWLNFCLGPGQHLLIDVSITGVYRDAVLKDVCRILGFAAKAVEDAKLDD